MSPRMWAAVDLSTTLVGVSLSTKLVGVYPVDLPQQATATSQPTNPNQTISQPYLNPISTLSQPYLNPIPNPIPQPYPANCGPQTWCPNHCAWQWRPTCGAILWCHPAAPPYCTPLLRHPAAPPCGATLRQCPVAHSAAVPCGGTLWRRTGAANCGSVLCREMRPRSARGELWPPTLARSAPHPLRGANYGYKPFLSTRTLTHPLL